MEKIKKFKMPNSFTTLFIIIILVAVMTWIIPAGQYEVADGNFVPGTYEQIEQSPQGIWEVLAAPILGLLGTEATEGAIEVSLFIMVVGGFLAIVNKTGAVDAGIATLIRGGEENVNRLIWVLMFVFALGGSTYGMAEETMAFYPLLIPLMVTVGMDSLTAVAVILVGSGVGVLSSTVNPFATGVASQMANISMADGMLLRILFFIITYLMGAFYVSRYAKRVRADNSNSYIADKMEQQKEEFSVESDTAELTTKQKVILVLFTLTFIIMILGLVPWSDLLGRASFFENMHETLLGVPILGNLVGQSSIALGQWYLVEITILFFAMSILIAIVYGINESVFVDTFLEGMKDLVTVAMITAVARGIQVIMNDGQITATVLHWGELALSGVSEGIFTVFTYLFYIPMSFLIPSTSGLAAATMGIMGPLGQFAGVGEAIVVTAYQAASGIINLITPTSGVVMGALAIADIDWGTWLKFMGKLLGLLVIVSIGLLLIGTYLNI
jgi:uncharacterized ion transporter superfamily protein YfcC